MLTESLIVLLPSLLLFSISATLTPGPNNILLAYSGANFGVKNTLAHIFGIRFGMTCIHIVMLLGLGTLFERFPQLHQLLTLLACSYMVYLAIKIVKSKNGQAKNQTQPMTFVQAALFQLINPKSWAMLLTLVTALTLPGNEYWSSAIFGIIVFNLATLPCSFFWVLIGCYMKRFLDNHTRLKQFNIVMAVLLLLTIPLILW